MDEKINGFRCYYCILPKKRVMMELKFNRREKLTWRLGCWEQKSKKQRMK